MESPMNTLQIRQKAMVDKFAAFPNWQDRYKELIAMGKQIPEMPKALYDEKFLVKGCQSQVWLKAHQSDAGTVVLEADSCLLYTSPSPRDRQKSRMPSSA